MDDLATLERKRLRLMARDSFAAFAEYAGFVLDPSYRMTPLHREIADILQSFEEGALIDHEGAILNTPPGTGKTALLTLYMAWCFGRNPDHRILFATYAADKAQDVGRDLRKVIYEQDVFPGLKLRTDSSAAGRFNIEGATGIFHAVGLRRGQVTGKRWTIGLIDDAVKNAEEADSGIIKRGIWESYLKDWLSRRMPDKLAFQVNIQTRWALDDLAGRQLELATKKDDQRWKHIVFPAIVTADGVEQSFCPERFDLRMLKDVRETYRLTGQWRAWCSLYQQDPIEEEGDFLKVKGLKTEDAAPEELTYYVGADFGVAAGSAHWTEFCVVGVDKSWGLHIVDWYGCQQTSDVWVGALLDLIAKWRPRKVFAESGVIRRAVEPWLASEMRKRTSEGKTGHLAEIVWLASSASKEARARSLQGMLAAGVQGVPVLHTLNGGWMSRLIPQLAMFPQTKHSGEGAHDADMIDALSKLTQGLDEMRRPTNLGKVQVDKWNQERLVW